MRVRGVFVGLFEGRMGVTVFLTLSSLIFVPNDRLLYPAFVLKRGGEGEREREENDNKKRR